MLSLRQLSKHGPTVFGFKRLAIGSDIKKQLILSSSIANVFGLRFTSASASMSAIRSPVNTLSSLLKKRVTPSSSASVKVSAMPNNLSSEEVKKPLDASEGKLIQPWSYDECVRLVYLATGLMPTDPKDQQIIADLIPKNSRLSGPPSSKINKLTMKFRVIAELLGTNRSHVSCWSQFNKYKSLTKNPEELYRLLKIAYDGCPTYSQYGNKKRVFRRWSVDEEMRFKLALQLFPPRPVVTTTSEQDSAEVTELSMSSDKRYHVWCQISEHIGTRTAYQCFWKWRRSIFTAHNKKRGRFTPDEITKLMKAWKMHGNSWVKVSQVVGTRSPEQCRLFINRVMTRVNISGSPIARPSSSNSSTKKQATG